MDKNISYTIAILAVVSLVISIYGFVYFPDQLNAMDQTNSELNASINDLTGVLDSVQGQLTTLQNQSLNIQSQILAYQTNITLLQQQFGLYQGNITELEQLISEQQEQINQYQTNITELEGELQQYQEITLVDMMGNIVTLNSPPQRIVSLSPSNTEILFAVGAGGSVVGVTDYCNYPYDFSAWIAAGNMTSIGNYFNPSVEPIVALNPDLVLASTGSLDAAATLKNLGYKVLVVEGKTIDGVLQDVLLIGRATYNNAEASALVTAMRTRIDAVVNAAKSATTTPTVYHEVWNEPLMSVGPSTFIDELITLAGGENIFHDASTSWPIVSSEAIIQKDPDVMFFPDMYMGVGNFYETIEAVAGRSGWNTITAVQNGALYEINADIISRSGPRLVDALELIAKMVHPEIFGEL